MVTTQNHKKWPHASILPDFNTSNHLVRIIPQCYFPKTRPIRIILEIQVSIFCPFGSFIHHSNSMLAFFIPYPNGPFPFHFHSFPFPFHYESTLTIQFVHKIPFIPFIFCPNFTFHSSSCGSRNMNVKETIFVHTPCQITSACTADVISLKNCWGYFLLYTYFLIKLCFSIYHYVIIHIPYSECYNLGDIVHLVIRYRKDFHFLPAVNEHPYNIVHKSVLRKRHSAQSRISVQCFRRNSPTTQIETSILHCHFQAAFPSATCCCRQM